MGASGLFIVIYIYIVSLFLSGALFSFTVAQKAGNSQAAVNLYQCQYQYPFYSLIDFNTHRSCVCLCVCVNIWEPLCASTTSLSVASLHFTYIDDVVIAVAAFVIYLPFNVNICTMIIMMFYFCYHMESLQSYLQEDW